MNKSQSKYFNTARLMDQALLLLLDKKSFEYITVKEVCQKAGVNRSTFYLHYENMTDLLAESLQYMFDQLKNKYSQSVSFDIDSANTDSLMWFTPSYSVPYLQFIKEHKKAFMAAISQPQVFGVESTYRNLYQQLFEPILDRYSVPQQERPYMISFYMNGIHAIINQWIKGDCKDDIDYIAQLIVKYVNSSKAKLQ